MAWSEEQRRLQAARIRQRQPWLKSTGPRSEAGKQRSSKNAFKGGKRKTMREFARLIRGLKLPPTSSKSIN
jgi:hypothetical protein